MKRPASHRCDAGLFIHPSISRLVDERSTSTQEFTTTDTKIGEGEGAPECVDDENSTIEA